MEPAVAQAGAGGIPQPAADSGECPPGRAGPSAALGAAGPEGPRKAGARMRTGRASGLWRTRRCQVFGVFLGIAIIVSLSPRRARGV